MTTRELQQPAKSPGTVPVVVDNHRVYVELTPKQLALIVPPLQFPLRRFRPAEDGTLVESVEPERYYTILDDGRLETRLGMLPLVQQALAAHGYRTQVEYDFFFPTGGMDRAVAQDPRFTSDTQQLLLQTLVRPAGLIYAGHQQHVPNVVAALANCYPRASLFIASSRRKEMLWLRQQIGQLTGRRITFWNEVFHEGFCDRPYLTIATSQHVGALNVDYHIVLFADTASALTTNVHRFLPGMRDQLLYAFVQPHEWQRLDVHQQLRLEWLFGPLINGDDDMLVTTQAVMVQAPALSASDRAKLDQVRAHRGPDEALQRKRIGIWHNGKRNQLIVSLAVACARQDLSGLQELGVAGPAVVDVLAKPRTVAVLVETAEHARQLHQYLPDWLLLDAVPVAVAPVAVAAGDEPEIEQELLDLVIATMVHADRSGLHANILIRCDGTATLWNDQWGIRYSPSHPGTALVLDVEDTFDHLAAADARTRLDDYERRRWMP